MRPTWLVERMDKDAYPRCATCRYWQDGECTSGKMREQSERTGADDELVYPYAEGGKFYPGPAFGCVHHEPLARPSRLVGMTVQQMIENDDGELATYMTAGYTPQEAVDEILHWDFLDRSAPSARPAALTTKAPTAWHKRE